MLVLMGFGCTFRVGARHIREHQFLRLMTLTDLLHNHSPLEIAKAMSLREKWVPPIALPNARYQYGADFLLFGAQRIGSGAVSIQRDKSQVVWEEFSPLLLQPKLAGSGLDIYAQHLFLESMQPVLHDAVQFVHNASTIDRINQLAGMGINPRSDSYANYCEKTRAYLVDTGLL